MPQWVIVGEELPTAIGLEDGLSLLLMEDGATTLAWGEVWEVV